MKITMFEIEANAEDLRASRNVAETLAMAIGRIADAFCGYGEAVEESAPEEAEGSEE